MPRTGARTDADVQANITAYWNQRADSYDDHRTSDDRRGPDHVIWTDIWRSVLPAARCDVLDVGTGTGYVARILAELGHRVTGIDLSPDMLDAAATSHAHLSDPPTLRLGDAVDPPLPAASVDAITARYVMWTLRRPEEALRNWHRLLRPGGLLAVVDSTWFPDGIDDGTSCAPGSREAAFRELYDPEVRAALPVAEATSIDPTAALLATAGFSDVTVAPLQALYDLDARVGVAAGHEVQMQYLITAHRD